MTRASGLSAVLSCSIFCLLLAGSAAGQTQMLTATNPIMLTSDGQPSFLDVNDEPVLLTHATGNPGDLDFTSCVGTDELDTFPDGNGIVMGFGFDTGPEIFRVTSVDTSDVHPRPIVWEYDEEPISGVVAFTATFVDTNGNNKYEHVRAVGQLDDNTPFDFVFTFLFHDANSDLFPDYVTFGFPPELGSVLFFDCTNNYNQLWVPVARDLQGDPAVILDLNGAGGADAEFLWGPKFEGARSILEIPTLSRFGVAALAFLLLFAGLWLARRRGQPTRGA